MATHLEIENTQYVIMEQLFQTIQSIYNYKYNESISADIIDMDVVISKKEIRDSVPFELIEHELKYYKLINTLVGMCYIEQPASGKIIILSKIDFNALDFDDIFDISINEKSQVSK